jgi:[protein-PII] uridylyltransferase
MAILAAPLKAQLKAAHQRTIDNFRNHGKTPQLLAHLRRNVDTILKEVWRDFAFPANTALVAVGGYGRGELFPHSDVDVLILLESAPDAPTQEKLENLIQLFWDIGLEIGHSIRTIDECLSESAADVTVQTSLLEARLVIGSRSLFNTLQARFDAAMNPQAFFQAKTLEMHQRHIKFEDTPYSLEPNCKESPGGLRDLQVILWTAKAAGLGNSWHQLAQHGLLTSTEARQLTQKERILKDIRIRLHLLTNRREDRLIFDVQTRIAETFGFQNTETRRSSEYLMQRYYWAAKTVTQLNNILLQNIASQLFPQSATPKVINARFNDVNGFLDIAHDNLFQDTPSAMLEVFLLLAQHPELKDMSARTLRALWHAHFKINHAFRRDPVNRSLFMQILQSKRGITHALRRMNHTSVLGRYLPNFRRIVGQMQHDLFHVYTVDQHTLMVVRNVRRFTMTEHAHEYPFCSQLMANFSQPWVLYIAALFHDIAKGRGGDHSKLGMADARQFCERHGISKENTELVVFLVEHHLTMSQFAQKQDLSDPDVILQFTKLIKDERHLTALYLLTVADIRGTSPKVWNAWKGKLLEDLYRITLRVLGGEAPSADRELKNTQLEAIKLLRLSGLPADVHEQFWQQLDVGYFLRLDASDIAWQTRSFYDKLDSDKPQVKCRLASEGIQIAVYTKDHEDLFARICGYFDAKNINILDAKVHTTKHEYALDTFLIAIPEFSNNYRDIINLIEYELAAHLSSEAPLAPPVPGRLSRLSRTFPLTPSVTLRPDERGQYYILSISASDRNGLLYTISSILTKYKVNLQMAKIATLGERAEDVFLIDGEALNHARTQIQLETELMDALRI